MTWVDLAAMLADAAQEPAIALVCAMCIIVAGLLGGLSAQRQHTEPPQDQEAGDTQAGWDAPWPHPWEERS